MVLGTKTEPIVVLSDYDVIDTIRENVSDDVADFVDRRFHELNEQQRYEELKFNSDFSALEQSLDAYSSALNDIWLLAEELSNILSDNSKKLNRIQLCDKLEEIIAVTRQF